jgi:octaprenyl-diphosphate synthase
LLPPARAIRLTGEDLYGAEQRLRALVGSRVEVVAAIGAYLTEAGGKRLRPMLTALGARAVGHTGDISGLMCVGELIHLGSLLHDDVVDEGLERRGRPTAQRVYGNAAVILTGDFCLARAVLLAGEEGGHRAVTELGAAVTAMAEGEVLQLQRAGKLTTTLEEYLEMVDKKSAALIAWCAAAGAWAAKDEVAAQALVHFGRGVGVAFQITDDVLDYSSATGKTPGQDLRERKLTLPLVYAMQRIPGLQERLAENADIPALVEEIRASGALEDALADARRRADRAIAALSVLPPSDYRDALVELGSYLVERAT